MRDYQKAAGPRKGSEIEDKKTVELRFAASRKTETEENLRNAGEAVSQHICASGKAGRKDR